MDEPLVDVTVELVGHDGNAFSIISKVSRAIRDFAREQETQEDREKYMKMVTEFRTEAMSGDYDHLLQTAMKYVNVE